ncbi:MAG TPA: enoyl-CoA hydratase/isomerase family protein [Planctomycetota bacterium]|jgi:enoyl-CoA hydratase/carnithine racemase|nr:enoyl-CoA hydratase/isomerase family protein [Planctomycetota bacterium]
MTQFPSRPAGAFAFEEIRYEKGGGVATVTIARPNAFNAYTTRTLRELGEALRDAANDDETGVIVLTGAGARAFCTGGDVKEYAETYTRRPRDYWKYMGLFRAYLEAILDSGKPTIARLNGMAVGGGNETQLACDFALAAEHAVLKQVGTHVGSVACGGATQWLSLAVGDRRARRMLFTNEAVPARRALEWGLVSEVAPSVTRDGTLLDRPSETEVEQARRGEGGYGIDLRPLDRAVADLAARLLDTFPECTRYTKEQANFWKNFAWHQTVGHARDWLALHFACLEPLEGMRAFAEKRPPDRRGIRARAAAGGSGEFPWGPYARACAACGAAALPASFAFCGRCGAALAGEEKKCATGSRDARRS